MAETSSMSVQQAARELRAHLQRSQQSMATFLGLSMAALRNHESGAVATPDARTALAYMMTAEASDRSDLAQVFRVALHRVMGVPIKTLGDLINDQGTTLAPTFFMESMNFFERRLVTVLLACIRGQGPFKKYQKSVFEALRRPYDLPISDKALESCEKETLRDQMVAFERAKVRKRQPQKDRVSA